MYSPRFINFQECSENQNKQPPTQPINSLFKKHANSSKQTNLNELSFDNLKTPEENKTEEIEDKINNFFDNNFGSNEGEEKNLEIEDGWASGDLDFSEEREDRLEEKNLSGDEKDFYRSGFKNRPLEDIIEESNESMTQSEYSSMKKVIHSFIHSLLY